MNEDIMLCVRESERRTNDFKSNQTHKTKNLTPKAFELHNFKT